MKLTIPKTILICGQRWKITQEKKKLGGNFNSTKCEIKIGTLSKPEVPDVFIHEVFESILAMSNLRYGLGRQGNENGDLIFVFNHKEFEKICSELALSLFEENQSVPCKKKRNLNTNKTPHETFANLPSKRISIKSNKRNIAQNKHQKTSNSGD